MDGLASAHTETPPLEAAIDAAVDVAVEEAIDDVAIDAVFAESKAELAIEIATQAADDAALGDAILGEEIKLCLQQHADLQVSLSERVLALETSQALLMTTVSTLQTLLADCQMTLSLIRTSSDQLTENPPTEKSTQKPHTDEKPTELPESAADDKQARPQPKKAPDLPKRRKVLWG
jgi:hypothetical protein